MSAFYDIWIHAKDTIPPYKRKKSKDWQHADGDIWFSYSAEDKGFARSVKKDGYHLILVGQLYEIISDEELVQRCITYIMQPQKEFDDPAGHYIIFLTDGNKKQKHVFTNRLGSYHAYWSADGAISTYYLGLAKTKLDKKLDWEGITGFMAMGYFPEDTTYLEDVNIFEPGAYYAFDDQLQLLDKKKYYKWTHSTTSNSEEHYAELLHEILQSCLSVATKNRRTAIPLSGGLDSRLLAGELTEEGLLYTGLQAFSYGYSDSSPELKIAKQIAEKRNIPLYAYKMPDYLFEKLDEIIDSVELFQYVDGTRQASAKEWLTANADVVVGGHWGDVWMDNMHVNSKDELLEAFRKKIIKKGADWLRENICEPQLKNGKVYLDDYFSRFVNRYNDIADADFIMKIYKTEQWSFRWTAASLRMYQSASFPVLPFYDKRVVDLFSTMQTSMVSDRAFQVNYLKHYYDDLARITWQEYDANLYSYKYFNNRNIGYRVVDKVRRTVSTEKTIQRNWEVFYLNPGGRKNLEEKLLNNKILNDIVPVVRIKQLLDDLQANPTAANGYSVSMLLTFSLFLQEVFEN